MVFKQCFSHCILKCQTEKHIGFTPVSASLEYGRHFGFDQLGTRALRS
jgi:hypothetical protein